MNYILNSNIHKCVAKRLSFPGIFDDTFVANLLLSLSLKELRKSVNIWWN